MTSGLVQLGNNTQNGYRRGVSLLTAGRTLICQMEINRGIQERVLAREGREPLNEHVGIGI
jgi:hypothetical protein